MRPVLGRAEAPPRVAPGWRRLRALALRGALALAALAGSGTTALAACEDRMAKKKVVLLEVTVPVADGGFDTHHRTGVVVSDTGLVLTVYDLIGHIKPNELIGMAPEELDGKASISLPGRRLKDGGASVAATILGHDWRRNILLLKIPALDQIDPSPAVAELSRKSIRDVDTACFVSLSKIDGASGFTPKVSDVQAVERMARGIGYRGRDLSSSIEQHGGAVLDAADGSLVGMIHAPHGDHTHLMPIEYADTLLSQLFIARITGELDNVLKLTRQIKVGASWDFQIRENKTDMLQDEEASVSDAPSLKIRFFFSQHVREDIDRPISLSEVDLLITLTGIRKNDHGDTVTESVNLKTDQNDRRDRERYPISPGANHFDYNASRQIEAAVKQGFISLVDIRVSILPDFKIGRETGHTGSKHVFDITLDPLVGRRNDAETARTE